MKIIKLLILSYFLSNAVDNYGQQNWIIYSPEPLDLTSLKSHQETSDIRRIFKNPYMYALSAGDATIKDLHKRYEDQPAVIIFKDQKLEKRISPNDPRYGEQWSLPRIGLEEVWTETTGMVPTGRTPVVIAVLDDGFDMDHPDLIDNWWTNEGEIPNDNIDNDNNRYIDDYRGFSAKLLNDEHVSLSHGTQVAGIIGAEGDNDIGITGITWNMKMLAISDVNSVGELLQALDYVYEMKKLFMDTDGEFGANIVVNNFSGGIRNEFPDRFPGWCEAYERLGTVGVLSVAAVANEELIPEEDGDMPTLCDSEFLITVTNTSKEDLKIRDSAESKISVDIGAPGTDIITTDVNGTYLNLPGTSASSPHVAGAAALLYTLDCDELQDLIEANPVAAAREVKNALIENVDQNNSLTETVSGGRVNVLNSALSLTEFCGESALAPLDIKALYSQNATDNKRFVYETDRLEEHQFFIYNPLGQLVYSSKLFPTLFGDKVINLDDNILETTGVYIATLSNDSDLISTKFLYVKN